MLTIDDQKQCRITVIEAEKHAHEDKRTLLAIVFCGINLLPPLHFEGVEISTDPMSIGLEFQADAAKREKHLLALPCRHPTNLSRAPAGLDQIGKWVTGTVSPHWEFSTAAWFGSVPGLGVPLSSTFM